MKTLNGSVPRLAQRLLGAVALVLGSGAAAAPAPAGTARAPGVETASPQLMARAEAQAAQAGVQSGKPAPCPHKHQHGLRYSVQRLAVPSGLHANLTAINNHGWVVGSSHTSAGARPMLWIGGVAYYLDSAVGPGGAAYDINDAGQIVGTYANAEGRWRAFSWYRGKLTTLRNLASETDAYAQAQGINRHGIISGASAQPNAPITRAVHWHKGVPRPLASLGGNHSFAYRINELGYSVGVSNEPDLSVHAALWTPKGEIVDLGADAEALDINDKGRIVGFAGLGIYPKPAKWYQGVRTVLPTLGGVSGKVYGINEQDEAVGYSQTATGLERATIWFGAKPVQLDTLLDEASQGITINVAYAINDKGQIAAIERMPSGQALPLLLTPRRCHGK